MAIIQDSSFGDGIVVGIVIGVLGAWFHGIAGVGRYSPATLRLGDSNLSYILDTKTMDAWTIGVNGKPLPLEFHRLKFQGK